MLKNILYPIILYSLNLFVFANHFDLMPVNSYVRNVTLLLIIYYWVTSAMYLFCLIIPLRIVNVRDVEVWGNFYTKSTYRILLRSLGYMIILGYGIIGKWSLFVPALMGTVFGLLLKDKVKPLVKQYLEENKIPVPEKKVSGKVKSRYELIKKRRI